MIKHWKDIPRQKRKFSFINKMYIKLKDVYYWIRHRTIDRYDIIKLNIPYGYYDKDYQMEYALMSLIIDYVEQELRYIVSISNEDHYENNFFYKKWVKSDGGNKFYSDILYKCYELTSKHEKYNNDFRENLSGYEILNQRIQYIKTYEYGNIDYEEYRKDALDFYNELKELYIWCKHVKDNYIEVEEDEMTDYMIRIIKIRKRLWT